MKLTTLAVISFVLISLATALAWLLLVIVPGQAAVEGDLLLDWQISDNTERSVGTVDSGCRSFSSGTIVQIDVIAVNA
ncbi:MAG: hypothetical protein IH989_08830, partial [Planctomycetes bacterium]|nr:hypothetical protein [Planctomycetota bacterium]